MKYLKELYKQMWLIWYVLAFIGLILAYEHTSNIFLIILEFAGMLFVIVLAVLQHLCYNAYEFKEGINCDENCPYIDVWEAGKCESCDCEVYKNKFKTEKKQ